MSWLVVGSDLEICFLFVSLSRNLVNDDNGDLLKISHNILNSWKNYFSQLLNVHRVSDDRQVEMHTAEPIVPDPSPFEIEIAIAKLKMYK
jgi:galactose-1-phosphate uridylyltransferase